VKTPRRLNPGHTVCKISACQLGFSPCPSDIPVAKGINQQGKGGRGLPSARIKEMVTREGRTPVGENAHQLATRQIWRDRRLRQISEAEASKGRQEARRN